MALETKEEEEIVVMNMDNFQEIHVSNHPTIPQLQNQKHQKFRRNDSLEIESRTTSHVHHSNGSSMAIILQLAFQSLGIVYGDIGTSPLYVFSSVLYIHRKSMKDYVYPWR
ncbi:potassium transporter 1 [Lathyrus oleraceus]|uniref:potassium transporter 1 n=1 Tax=Pisum sativum TaxID=3888 RepID=UPI0021CE561D|nr:potassium transporter 1-like [Pisum sativum]